MKKSSNLLPDKLEKYRPYLEGYDLTEEQEAELIRTLWTIMESFVDQAFGEHPAQQSRSSAKPSREKSAER